jgi:hypothetical protein
MVAGVSVSCISARRTQTYRRCVNERRTMETCIHARSGGITPRILTLRAVNGQLQSLSQPRLNADFPPRWPGFQPRSRHVPFVMECHGHRFPPSTPVSPATHSTDCCTLRTIPDSRRRAEWSRSLPEGDRWISEGFLWQPANDTACMPAALHARAVTSVARTAGPVFSPAASGWFSRSALGPDCTVMGHFLQWVAGGWEQGAGDLIVLTDSVITHSGPPLIYCLALPQVLDTLDTDLRAAAP